MGRFLSTDPIGYGDGLNMYRYAANSPLNFRDPSGTDIDMYKSPVKGLGYLAAFGVPIYNWNHDYGSPSSRHRAGIAISTNNAIRGAIASGQPVSQATANSIASDIARVGGVGVHSYLVNSFNARLSGQRTMAAASAQLDAAAAVANGEYLSAKERQNIYDEAMKIARRYGLRVNERVVFDNRFVIARITSNSITGTNSIISRVYYNTIEEASTAWDQIFSHLPEWSFIAGATVVNSSVSTVYASAASSQYGTTLNGFLSSPTNLTSIQYMLYVIFHEVDHGRGNSGEQHPTEYGACMIGLINGDC